MGSTGDWSGLSEHRHETGGVGREGQASKIGRIREQMVEEPDPTQGWPIEEVDSSFLAETEDGMRSEFKDEAQPAGRLADIAVALLVRALEAVEPRHAQAQLGEDDEVQHSSNPNDLILGACTLIGAHAVRIIRAATAVLATGYENEARSLDRILVELMAHRRVILDDPSGREAVAWLRRKRRRGISRKVAAMGENELYGNLCVEAHGDPGAIMRLFNPTTNTIKLGPHRTPATRASLLLYAGFARDQAVVVSQLSGRTVIGGLDLLDEAIQKGWKDLNTETDSASR